jgi:hypothetical protein
MYSETTCWVRCCCLQILNSWVLTYDAPLQAAQNRTSQNYQYKKIWSKSEHRFSANETRQHARTHTTHTHTQNPCTRFLHDVHKINAFRLLDCVCLWVCPHLSTRTDFDAICEGRYATEVTRTCTFSFPTVDYNNIAEARTLVLRTHFSTSSTFREILTHTYRITYNFETPARNEQFVLSSRLRGTGSVISLLPLHTSTGVGQWRQGHKTQIKFGLNSSVSTASTLAVPV